MRLMMDYLKIYLLTFEDLTEAVARVVYNALYPHEQVALRLRSEVRHDLNLAHAVVHEEIVF
jgi:hypothetical protein